MRTLRFVLKVFNGLRFDEAERHRFGEAGGGQHAARELIARDARIRRGCGLRHHRERRLELVEAVVTADLFDQIGFAQQIHAEGWRDRVPAVSRGADGEAEALENPDHLRVGDGGAEHAREPLAAQVQTLRLPRLRVDVDDRSGRLAGADLLHQPDRALDRDHLRVGIGAALEARRGLRLQPEPLAGAPDRRRLEVRRLEYHGRRRCRDFGGRAAHHPGDALGAIAIGDHQHVGLHLPFDAVERRAALARPGAPRRERRPGEAVQVVGMHRLAELEVDVVRDVDDVADRTDAGRLQARRHPGGRAAHPDVGDGGREPRTQLRVVDRDRDPIRRAEALRHGERCEPGVGRRQRQVVRRRHLAREAEDAERVGAVGGDLEVDHRVAAVQRLDRRDLEAAQGERLRDVGGGRLYVDKFLQPRQN